MPTTANNPRIGLMASDFRLLDTISDTYLTLAECKRQDGILIMFVCNHCPYVVHVENQLAQIGEDYKDSTIGIAAISANDANKYPIDGPLQMKQRGLDKSYCFPYLYDEDQTTAKAYKAECTPDFLLFGGDGTCVYSGRLCPSTPGNDIAVSGSELRAAMNALLKGEIIQKQLPSMGCSIKWK